MKLVVIGLGSMGKRRIRLIKQKFLHEELIGIDTRQDRRDEVEQEYKIKTFSSLENGLKDFCADGALVCTHPITHSGIILECLERGLHVFTEINLVADKYEEIIKLAIKKEVELFLSSTMIYRKEIEFIHKNVIESKKKVNYRYHVGQYLPDWHPWENYKDFFIGDKRTNGCREILGIEMPWIIKTFGRVKNIFVIKDKISELEIDFEDCYNIILEHENGNKGSFNVDVVCRKPVRHLEIFSEDFYISWNGATDGLEQYNIKDKKNEKIELYKEDVQQNKDYASFIIENVYSDEINIFLKKIKKEENLERYTFKDDLYTLSIIDRIEGNNV